MKNYDIIILGSGPAGLTCGIYSSRNLLKTLVVDKADILSQVIFTELIENYPGFPDVINGYDLIVKMKTQAEKSGCEFMSISEQPTIKKIKDGFEVSLDKGSFLAKSIVIATGRRWKKIGIENEDYFIGKGISYCATCDAPFFKDKVVCVVGGGNAALQETLLISKFVKKLFLIHRRNEFRGTKILVEKVKNLRNVEILTPVVIDKLIGDKKIELIKVKYLDSKIEKEIVCDGVFVFIGQIPNTEFLKDTLKLDDDGYVITNEMLETSQNGIYACGDCRLNRLKQIVVACAEGAIVANSLQHYISL